MKCGAGCSRLVCGEEGLDRLAEPDPRASTWPHSQSWGYAPSGALGTVVLILIVLFLLG
jgi:hypothetical protein